MYGAVPWTTACSSAMYLWKRQSMKTFVALLYIAFANILLLGQTLGRDEANPPVRNPVVDRIERLAKAFPPELPAATNDRATVTPMRSYCVYPSPATRSLSIKP